ncbi:MAG: ABC transporter ATP-binding protein [Armatimonadota bacterium]|nr:ABC transporter ATP-binding protein/permease [bacterium]MDW8320189.1 ABC transporter ATP-binding protein [Armatimonadota bacterium]
MFWRLLGLMRPYTVPIVLGFICLMLATPAQMFPPLVWKYVVDEVIMNRKVSHLLPAMLVMLAVHLVGMGLSAARTYLLGVAGQRFVADLRNRLHEKLMRQSVRYHHDHKTGDQMSRVMGDVDTLQEVVINGVDNIVGNALSLIWVAGIIVWLNWKVGTLTLLPLAVVAVMVWFFNLRVKGLYRAIRDRLGDLSAKLQENLLGVLVVKAFAREAYEQERFQQVNAEYTHTSLKGVKVRSVYFPGVMTVGFLSNIAMIGAGAYFVLKGEFTIGGLVAYRGYWWQLFAPVFSLAQVNEMIQRAIAAASRVFEVIDAHEEVTDAEGAIVLDTVNGHIRFDRVSFAYTPDRPILQEVSFEVLPGQRIGIVGPSGTGKTTVLNLMLRLYDPQEGVITLDGHDLRCLQQQSFRRHIALVTQEPFLFNDTVRQNILFGRLDATDEEIETAARLANAHDFICDLPDGYDTLVGERGVKLSGGQKQRICIARAFLANPKVLLLDEATASVEPESEALIQAALERLMQGRTTIIVTHRLSLVRDCDRILVFDEGRVIESGSHQELMALEGWYARMYRLQMEGGSLAEELVDWERRG